MFEDEQASTGIRTRYRDSVVVQVIRRGDTLFVQRESINPALAYLGTGVYSSGQLTLKIRRWYGDASSVATGTGIAPPVSITYSITR